ncbi:serine/threonine protein kinase [Solirubrobacter taibaiensis]|nr:serine/threonine protein kinase [Solirubrobacter taibaiensis]
MCAATLDAFDNDVPAMFSPGETVGTYVIERRLGAGGFGEVFLARERLPNRRVALKVVRPEFAADPLFMERFEREVDALAAVEHPNVVPIYAHGQARGLQYFSMRYVEGGSLDALLAARRPPLHDVIELLAGVAEGLDHCHARGIVHRDLKPANVLVDSVGGHALLADFGVARADDIATITGPGHVLGTPAYMAPETLMGDCATPASDLWALGAVAYRAATGSLPRGLSQPPDTESVPPSRRNEGLGPDIDRVILRALSLDPGRRYRSGRAFVADLRAALDAPGLPARRKLGSRRWMSVAGAALVFAPMAAFGLPSLRGEDCHAGYTGACLKPDSVDYDCKRGNGNGPDFVSATVRVTGSDPYKLDRDGDGFAC